MPPGETPQVSPQAIPQEIPQAPQVPVIPPGGSICPACGNIVPPDFIFCPRCGKQIKEPPISTTVFTQTWMYLLSIFLPPLGLWPGIKYVRHSDPKAKKIGWIAIGLTIVSCIVTIWATFAFLNVYLNTFNETLNGLGGY